MSNTIQDALREGLTNDTDLGIFIPSSDGLDALPEVSGLSDLAICDGYRALGMMLVRWSDKYADGAFDMMREQSYQNCRDIPAMEAIRKAGMKPMRKKFFNVKDGEGKKHSIRVEQLQCGRTKAFVFFHAGYWHVWSKSSAATENDEYHNEFTSILVALIRLLRPRDVFAATISRLVRSTHQANVLSTAARGNVDRIVSKDLVFDLRPTAGPMGFVMLSLMAMMAAMERDFIVQRLLAGRIGKWRRNEWAHGRRVVPFGYYICPKTKQLLPDESKKAIVEEMLLILQSDLPPNEKARQLDSIGVTATAPDPKTGELRQFSALVDPEGAIRGLMSWAPVWLSGEYLFRIANSFPGQTEVNGVPVVRTEEDDIGELQMLYKVPLPHKGWATKEVRQGFRQAAIGLSKRLVEQGFTPTRPVSPTIQRRSKDAELLGSMLSGRAIRRLDPLTQQRRNAAAARASVSAMLERRWQDEHSYYELRSYSGSAYKIVRWSKEHLSADELELDQVASRQGRGARDTDIKYGSTERRTVGYVDGPELMAGMPAALIGAIRSGIPAEYLPGEVIFSGAEFQGAMDARQNTIDILTERLAYVRKRLKASRDLVVEARAQGDAEAEAEYKATVERHKVDIDKLTAKLAEKEVVPKERVIAGAFDVVANIWMPAMEAITGSAGKMNPSQRAALKVVIPTFSMENRNGQWFAAATVRVNTTNGVAELGPVEWPVKSREQGGQIVAANIKDVPKTGRTRMEITRDLIQDCKLVPDAAHTAMNAPFAQIAQVLLWKLVGQELPNWVSEQWRDEKFANHLVTVYTDPNWSWLGAGRYLRHNPVRQYLAALASSEQRISIRSLEACVLANGPRSILRLAFAGDIHGSKERRNASTIREWQPSVLVVEPGRSAITTVLGPVRCSCKNSSTFVARVPEVLSDMLCRCGLMPNAAQFGVDPGLRFPDEYLALAVPTDQCFGEIQRRFDDTVANPTKAQIELLTKVGALGATTEPDLARFLGRQPGKLFASLDKLRLRGFVASTTNSPVRWTLTEPGRELIAKSS